MLRFLQNELPRIWTDELYSEEFKASRPKTRDFQHTLLHVMKTVGKLATMVEEVDHGNASFDYKEVEKYLADVVICTIRLAIKNPSGTIDLEQAIFDRIEKKMGVKLSRE